MICTFFGHRDAPDSIRNSIRLAITTLVKENNVKIFYVGNNGNFDFIVQSVLEEMVKKEGGFEYFIVLSTPNENACFGRQDNTIFPEGLESALPKFSISKRNEWMIKNCGFVITYVRNSRTNAYKWAKKAERKGARVINLFDESSGVFD